MAKNFNTVGQGKLGKAFARLNMIGSEFLEKGRFYSWKLAVYNTAWWIGNYCHPLSKLQFWGTRKITEWMDVYLRKTLNVSQLLPPLDVARCYNLSASTASGCSGGREKTVCLN